MKKTKTQNKERLSYFRELYECAEEARRDFIENAERNMRQYLGSDEIDGSSERASAVRNITYEIIESEISSDIPVPKTDAACYTEARERNAHSIERLCTAIRRKLPFEELNDKDERYTYIYGSSIWFVEWDSKAEDNDDGGVSVHCLSPLSFFPEPGVERVEDMEYCFLTFTTTRAALMRKYGITEEEIGSCECEFEYGDGTASDTYKVVIGFLRDEDGEILRVVFSGDVILSEDERYYRRRLVSAGSDTSREVDSELIIDGGEEKRLPFYTPKRFPIVIRKNTAVYDVGYGSDCDKIRSQQQAINKVESRILQKLLRAGVTPIMPEDSTVNYTNSIFGQVIKMRPGESAQDYGKLDTTPDVSQDIEEADRLYDHAKRVLGISDALQGADAQTSESGYARQLKIAQSTSRLESKRRMKYLAYSEIYRLIFEQYLAFADKVRDFSYTDSLGRVCTSEFNRYNFYEPYKNGYRIYDDFLFSVDLNGGSEYSRETLWEKNLENLESGTLGDKTHPTTLLRYWQSQERAHYPYARENVEYFKAIVEKENDNKKT